MTAGGDVPFRRFADMARDVAAFAGVRRLAGLAVLTAAAAVVGGVGLLILVPVLSVLGIAGSERVAGGLTGLLGGPVRLEVGLAVYLLVVAAAAWVVRARGIAVAALRLAYVDDLRRRLHAALLNMEWSAFARLRGADVTHVTLMETGRAAQGVEFLLHLAAGAVEVPVLLAVAFGLSPAMAVGGVVLGGMAMLAARPLNRRTYALGHSTGHAHRALQRDLADDLAGMRVVRSHGLERRRHARFGERMATLRANQLAYHRSSSTARAATQIMAAAAAAAGVGVAVMGLGLALADTLVLMVAFARLAAVALRLQDGWRVVLNALPAHAAAHDLLMQCRASAEPVDDGVDGRFPAPRGEIRLQGVTFRYTGGRSGQGGAALNGVDAVLPACGVTAIVGPSGAGKSTLADLLLGLTVPNAGRILVDGLPMEGAARRRWRRRVGYVPQDSFLFHETVRDNLLLAAPGADEAALWRALERAAVADVVRALPRGLDTMVGDRGAALSGGERQRLALARALLREPDLLILDEATSALDGESERRVLAAVEALRGSVTVVVVAHRASTVRGADRVVVLEDGQVAAAGAWDEVERSAGPLLARLHLAH